jgi:glycosyltransferase involved in cell wall biosynthesis
VRRIGSHLQGVGKRPDAVEEFDSPAFRAALRQAVSHWQPAIAQLEFTQMAQYAEDCSPAHTILVEHDVTFDLCSQLLALGEDWDLRLQLKLWKRFETAAWGHVDRVVVMSERDRAAVTNGNPVVILNGVDLDRFRPPDDLPEPNRLLFIGSFAHLPNLLAVEFFLGDVWPRLSGATLHIIAGARHEYHLTRSPIKLDLNRPGIEVEGFVSDVRHAYARAAVVIAPLRASAGTNIKILEAMAMGRAIVSTRAGVNGLDLTAGEDFLLAESPEEFANAIQTLSADPQACARLGAVARRRVERQYNWDFIARAQMDLYRDLLGRQLIGADRLEERALLGRR